MVRPAPLLAVLIAAASGCAARPVPYRFAGPVIGAVSLDDVAEHGRRPAYDDGVAPPGDAVAHASELPGAPTRTDVPADAAAHGGTIAVVAGDVLWIEPAPPSGPGATAAPPAEPAPLPAPHREPRAPAGRAVVDTAAIGEGDVAGLRALVGRRDGRDHVAFALAAAAAIRGGPPATPVPADADGPALVAHATTRGARATPGERTVRPGDLVVFDRAAGGAPASLVAVVLSVDRRGVIEMLYVARGVVRRGFVDPARPRTARDADGAVVNTYVRHGRDHPPKGTRYLAGELIAHVIAYDAL